MNQIAQYQDGRLEIQDVPPPQAPPGGILVRTTHSVISPGTEKMKVEQAKMNLLQKARARPDQVRKVLDSAKTLGWRAAMEKVRNRLESPTPLGYSAAGEVIAVDPGNHRFSIGDRVAVGGAECAHHAEILGIPDLLATRIPDRVENWQAAFSTLGAISMHAFRQSEATLGENVLVMGSGLVGLLCTGIASAAGCRVMATDLDPARLAAADLMGAEKTVDVRSSSLADTVREWTGGHGVDRVLLCLGGDATRLVRDAVEVIRDRGTLVIVGIADANLEWKQLYEKEVDVRYSRSYGPGRYDPGYEWNGQDYPIGYVRWTEQRNFDSFLQLVAAGKLNLDPVVTRIAPFGEVLSVYSALMEPGNKDIGVVLEYGTTPAAQNLPSEAVKRDPAEQAAPFPENAPLPEPVSVLNVVGAGNFVRTMLLPHLKGKIPFGQIVNNTALSSRHAAEKFGFNASSTSPAEAFGGASNAAVLIGTRHNLHAPMVLDALESGMHAFVEKPLCLTREEMNEIDQAAASSSGSVMIGFNRRFAPAAIRMKEILATVPGPKVCSFHVCAGKLDPAHWYSNLEESGGRVLGEACHFFDFFRFILGAEAKTITAQKVWSAEGKLPFEDSIAAQISFADGSCAQLIYTAEGDSSWPKETATVYAAGLVMRCENFQSLQVNRKRKKNVQSYKSKGHAEEMLAWSAFLNGDAVHPLPYEDGRLSMNLTFAALEAIKSGTTENV